jgi:hypothetical protein
MVGRVWPKALDSDYSGQSYFERSAKISPNGIYEIKELNRFGREKKKSRKRSP